MVKLGSQFDYYTAAEDNPYLEEHLDAVTTLAHGTHEDPWGENAYGEELPATRTHVDPWHVNAMGGHTMQRIDRAREGYRSNPEKIPPVVLVQRGTWDQDDPRAGHPKYEVADGHHRTKAARANGMSALHAIVVKSPHDYELELPSY
jgi:hypothetical protein